MLPGMFVQTARISTKIKEENSKSAEVRIPLAFKPKTSKNVIFKAIPEQWKRTCPEPRRAIY